MNRGALTIGISRVDPIAAQSDHRSGPETGPPVRAGVPSPPLQQHHDKQTDFGSTPAGNGRGHADGDWMNSLVG
ncbi:uncharacterized protein N7482_008030 [Penicillium canariense]|uniref:Uncharacterized protein n=1 Tax=Penicillium canariense TaxID=189055 RepID=A0A9W9HVH2_9EURO|nr:uncharacterized protein N7482_008030 [Penicillium canariense]KAJ5156930.1 hypothetical protein N7482_008030 [Penicillium canariense]